MSSPLLREVSHHVRETIFEVVPTIFVRRGQLFSVVISKGTRKPCVGIRNPQVADQLLPAFQFLLVLDFYNLLQLRLQSSRRIRNRRPSLRLHTSNRGTARFSREHRSSKKGRTRQQSRQKNSHRWNLAQTLRSSESKTKIRLRADCLAQLLCQCCRPARHIIFVFGFHHHSC